MRKTLGTFLFLRPCSLVLGTDRSDRAGPRQPICRSAQRPNGTPAWPGCRRNHHGN